MYFGSPSLNLMLLRSVRFSLRDTPIRLFCCEIGPTSLAPEANVNFGRFRLFRGKSVSSECIGLSDVTRRADMPPRLSCKPAAACMSHDVLTELLSTRRPSDLVTHLSDQTNAPTAQLKSYRERMASDGLVHVSARRGEKLSEMATVHSRGMEAWMIRAQSEKLLNLLTNQSIPSEIGLEASNIIASILFSPAFNAYLSEIA
ncbi:unnamed protein product [Protopolystoma xenopodis]|uniref:Uncharacterized protein n=1 Tax=Protopolystoma xenopodis TaxID=117903 RepID=A0A3S5FC34_9PLAT|nr:unnamed protein product [Protopolystoma xenopodis]